MVLSHAPKNKRRRKQEEEHNTGYATGVYNSYSNLQDFFGSDTGKTKWRVTNQVDHRSEERSTCAGGNGYNSDGDP